MKSLRLYALVISLILLVAACSSDTSGPSQRFEPYPEENQMLGLTNTFRSQAQTCGNQQFAAAPVLTWVEAVGDTAWFHSTDMGAQDTENHVGASTVERLRSRGFEAGLTAEHRRKTSLPANPTDAFNTWTANPEACADLMNPSFTVMGAGLWGAYEGGNAAYWTLILTTPQENSPQPSLTLNPTTATATIGGPALSFSATLTGSTDAINWTLNGAGSLSTTTGATTNYMPPAAGDAGTATLTASAGALTASATITINAGNTPPPTNNVQELLTLVNQARAQGQTCGGEALPPAPALTLNAQLNRAAQLHSEDMGNNGYFSHTGLDGSSVGDRVAAQGYQGTFVGENIAAGQQTPQDVMASWLSSTGHCRNIMSADYTELGIGIARVEGSPFGIYWTQVFARPNNAVTPVLTVTPATTTVTIGGGAVTFNANLTNSNDTINWTLTGEGTLSSTTGATTDYTPPANGAAGTATLTATAGAVTATATITINAATPPATLTVSPATITLPVGGAATTFSATLTNSNDPISWALTGAGTLSTTNGVTTVYTPPAAGAAGTATLTATAGALTASATITLTAAPAPPANGAEEMLALVNQFRSQPQTCGGEALPAVLALTLDDRLNTAARLHSEDMANNNYFDHTGLNGSSFGDRIRAQGYQFGAGGENIAAGSATAQGAFNQWAGSPGHCRNMMSPNFTQLGVGYGQNANSDFTHYWTQVFATPQ